MKHLNTILATALVAVVSLTSCNGKGYTITGTADGFTSGDTLFLTTDLDTGEPFDSIVITDGTFSYSGETDTSAICMLYVKNQAFLNAIFFLEPGKISISLSQEPGQSRVSGTKANDAWQSLNDETSSMTETLQALAAPLYTEQLGEERQKAIFDSIQQVQQDMISKIMEAAEANIDNALGFFILTNYESDDKIFTPEKRLELINRLPAKERERQEVKDLLKTIEASKSADKGQSLPAFSLKSDKGEQLSLNEEVSRHEITILDFWASWCGPCREEMPNMKTLYAEYADKGLGIIGISVDQDPEAWTAAIKELALPWIHVNDTGEGDASPAGFFQVNAIPFMVIVDSKGQILEKGLRGPQLNAFVTERLKK